MQKIFRIISFTILLLICLPSYGSKKDCKYVKRKYKETYQAITEWSNRKSPDNIALQREWQYKQCKAFRTLAEKWKDNTGNDRQIIEHALLRWGWLKEDSFPNTSAIVDYHLVYMEYLQKKS